MTQKTDDLVNAYIQDDNDKARNIYNAVKQQNNKKLTSCFKCIYGFKFKSTDEFRFLYRTDPELHNIIVEIVKKCQYYDDIVSNIKVFMKQVASYIEDELEFNINLRNKSDSEILQFVRAQDITTLNKIIIFINTCHDKRWFGKPTKNLPIAMANQLTKDIN